MGQNEGIRGFSDGEGMDPDGRGRLSKKRVKRKGGEM